MNYEEEWKKLKKGEKTSVVLPVERGDIQIEGKIKEIGDKSITIEGKIIFTSSNHLVSSPIAVLSH